MKIVTFLKIQMTKHQISKNCQKHKKKKKKKKKIKVGFRLTKPKVTAFLYQVFEGIIYSIVERKEENKT